MYIRFSRKVEAEIFERADQHGIAPTEAARMLVDEGIEQRSIEVLLNNLEKSMTARFFEIACACINLSSVEKEEAKKVCNTVFQQELLG
jgi:hypothetical protein